VTSGFSPAELSALYAEIGRELNAAEDGNVVLQSIASLAARRVDGAEYAGVTVGRAGTRFATVAATDDIVNKTDAIQYELRSGPCVDAIVNETTFNVADLRADDRWPDFGPRCVAETGIVSMLSMRFYVEDDHELIAGLNMYSRTPRAFDEHGEALAHLLATHGAATVAKVAAERKSRNLLEALKHSRDIGVAMGVLMAGEKVTREQAFDLLRIASQRTHRKLAQVAAEVAETGELPSGPTSGS
jgi:ANTAR domain-containing protein/GAF domain-containing protein